MMDNLKCNWCGEIKPEIEFVKRVASKPYTQSNVRCCKECNTSKNRQRYAVPEIKIKQLAANASWRSENRDRQNEYGRRWLEKNPEKQQARNKVGHMMRRGYWTRQPCEICGSISDVEAHHDSYAEAHWLIVRWLCKKHHEAWHQIIDPHKNAILELPLEEVRLKREKHHEIMVKMNELRKEAATLKSDADSLELDTWMEVQKIAINLYPSLKK